MKNLLAILLVMFVGMSVVGCSTGNKRVESSKNDNCKYLYNSSVYIGDVRTFYENVSTEMEKVGFKQMYSYDYRGRLFEKEIFDHEKHVIAVEILAAPKIYNYNVLVHKPYISYSVKRVGQVRKRHRCLSVEDNLYKTHLNTINYIVERSAKLSK